jgi:hypothetical protein
LQPDGTISKKWPTIEGHNNVNVCSNGTAYRNLSPMKIGPFVVIEKKAPNPFYPSGIHPGFQSLNETHQYCVATNLENYWQNSKVFDVDVVNNIIQPSFYQRRAKGMDDPKPHRRALPKVKAHPVASYFDGNVYTYVASRIYYIFYYEQLVSQRPEYQDLLRRVNNGENIHILGFDGRDPASGLSYGANPITYEVLEREMYNPLVPFGHEFVICGMLLNLRPWQKFDMDRAIKINGALS